MVASDVADNGYPDTEIEDVRVMWQRPGFVLSEHARVIVSPEGRLAAYTDVFSQDGEAYISPNSTIHPDYRLLITDRELFRIAEGMAGDVERLRTVSTTVDRSRFLEANGYQADRWDWRMEIDLSEPPESPALPQGFLLRPFQLETDKHAVYQLVQVAFRDLPGHSDSPYETWESFMLRRDDFDPSLLLLVEKDGEPAGCAICYDYPDLGWVRQLAVRRDCRKRGLGLSLLRLAFSTLYQRGKRRVGLVVDTHNPTGAPQLYIRAGMHPAAQFVYYVKKK